MKLTKSEKELLEPARVARVATAGANGSLHNVPICPIVVGDKIYFASEQKATKVKNIQANANVAVVFDDYSETWGHLRGVMIRGQARIVGKQEFTVLRKKFYEKFMQYEDAAPLDEKDSAIIEVTPVSKFSWGL
jgi:nitroimidazol reductase NimA-like FMN-containing flavoprotein (pyridoxamine 5'-phosphate oxidase superfamily)